MTKIEVVALDMIGVLVQEEKLISIGLRDFLGSDMLVPLEEVKKRYDEGYCVGKLSRKKFWEGVVAEDWEEVERSFLDSRKFAADASEVCKRIQQLGIDLAVISDMPREWAESILDARGILSLLRVGVFSNDGRGSKKDGQLFQALLDDLNVPPSKVMLVDDRPKNVAKAKELGMQALYLPLPGDGPDPTADVLTLAAFSKILS